MAWLGWETWYVTYGTHQSANHGAIWDIHKLGYHWGCRWPGSCWNVAGYNSPGWDGRHPIATFTHARSDCGAEAGRFWYSRSATAGMFTHTRSGRGRICHFWSTMMVWSARFRSGRGKLGVGPISCGAVFAPAPPPLLDSACVNACNDLCWSQFSACVCVNVPLVMSLPRTW